MKESLRALPLACLVAVGLTVLGCQVPQDGSTDAVIARARTLVHAHKDLEAHHVIDAAIESGDSAPILRKKRAEILWLLRAYELAKPDLQEYLKAEPSDEYGWYLLGFCLAECHRPVAALEAFWKCASLGSTEADLRDRIGDAEEEVKRVRRVLDELVSGVARGAGGPEYWMKRITLALQLGQLEDAMASAVAWCEAMPDYPARDWGRLTVACERGDWQLARDVAATLESRGIDPASTLFATSAASGDWVDVVRLTDGEISADLRARGALRFRALGCLALRRYEEYVRVVGVMSTQEK